jgi:hypothetical protein
MTGAGDPAERGEHAAHRVRHAAESDGQRARQRGHQESHRWVGRVVKRPCMKPTDPNARTNARTPLPPLTSSNQTNDRPGVRPQRPGVPHARVAQGRSDPHVQGAGLTPWMEHTHIHTAPCCAALTHLIAKQHNRCWACRSCRPRASLSSASACRPCSPPPRSTPSTRGCRRSPGSQSPGACPALHV